MATQPRLLELRRRVKDVYKDKADLLPFHGWHHVDFVRSKAIEFGKSISADLLIIESAALTHDLNFVVETNSNPEKGAKLRQGLLSMSGYSPAEVSRIERVIIDTHMQYRANDLANKLSDEAKAVSDADTLFKALPLTPILFAHKYLSENSLDIFALAEKIAKEQNPLMFAETYFYTPLAKKKYMHWAETNLDLWNNVVDALKDRSVLRLLSTYWRLSGEKHHPTND